MRSSSLPLVPFSLLVQPPVLLFLLAVTHQFLYTDKVLLLAIREDGLQTQKVSVFMSRLVGSGSQMGKFELLKSMSNCLPSC